MTSLEFTAADSTVISGLEGASSLQTFFYDKCRPLEPTLQSRSYIFDELLVAGICGLAHDTGPDIARERRNFWLPSIVNNYLDARYRDGATITQITFAMQQEGRTRPDASLTFKAMCENEEVEFTFERDGEESPEAPFLLKNHFETGVTYRVDPLVIGKTVLGLCFEEPELMGIEMQTEIGGRTIHQLDPQDNEVLLMIQKAMQGRASEVKTERTYVFHDDSMDETLHIVHTDSSVKPTELVGTSLREGRHAYELTGTCSLDEERNSPYPLSIELDDVDGTKNPLPGTALEDILIKEFRGTLKRFTDALKNVGLESTEQIAQTEARVRD